MPKTAVPRELDDPSLPVPQGRHTDEAAPREIEPSIGVITHVQAPREQVFRAVTDASQASRFFKPLLPLQEHASGAPT